MKWHVIILPLSLSLSLSLSFLVKWGKGARNRRSDPEESWVGRYLEVRPHLLPNLVMCCTLQYFVLCLCLGAAAVFGTKWISAYQRKFAYISHVCWRYSSTAQKPGPLHSLNGSDWIHFTHDVNDGSFTSDGTITLPMMKSYIEQVSSQPHLSSTNEGLDCSVTLPDSPMMFQQTRSPDL